MGTLTSDAFFILSDEVTTKTTLAVSCDRPERFVIHLESVTGGELRLEGQAFTERKHRVLV